MNAVPPGVPAAAPAPAVTATVVVCVYTEKRWGDIVDGGRVRRRPGRHAGRDDRRRRPQPGLLAARRPELARRGAGAGQRARPGPVRAPATPPSPRPRRRRGVPRRRRPARPGWLAALLEPYEDPPCTAVGGRGPPALADVAATAAAAPRARPARTRRRRRHRRAGLDRRLHLHGPADRAGRGAQPHGLQHVVPARGVRAHRRLRRGDRPHRQEPAGLRGDRALHPRPAGLGRGRARRSGSCSSRAPRSTTASADDRVEWAYLRRRSWAEGLSKAAVAQARGLRRRAVHRARLRGQGAARRRSCASCGERHVASAAAVVAALAWTTAGYVRGRLPGATSGVRLPAAGATPNRWLSTRDPPGGSRSFVHHRARLTDGQQARLGPLVAGARPRRRRPRQRSPAATTCRLVRPGRPADAGDRLGHGRVDGRAGGGRARRRPPRRRGLRAGDRGSC